MSIQTWIHEFYTARLQRKPCQIWECCQIMRKSLNFDLNELYELQILLRIDSFQRKLYTDFWLAFSALHDAFHIFFWFYSFLFWSNLTGILNFNFVLCWFESFYAGISKTCIFLSMLHTICADMLIICCTLFPEAVFLSFMRFLALLWFLMRLQKHI